MNIKKATLAAGCFWCVEAVFQQLRGVSAVRSGYMGGHLLNPTYKQVCSGQTGHAEVIQLDYDENELSFEEILEVFFKTHDPTTLNRQGADVGSQYRSAIFYHSSDQKTVAETVIAALNKAEAFDKRIVTTLEPADTFYVAEDYHQNYYNENEGSNPYCTMVVRPKVEKFRKVFANKLKV